MNHDILAPKELAKLAETFILKCSLKEKPKGYGYSPDTYPNPGSSLWLVSHPYHEPHSDGLTLRYCSSSFPPRAAPSDRLPRRIRSRHLRRPHAAQIRGIPQGMCSAHDLCYPAHSCGGVTTVEGRPTNSRMERGFGAGRVCECDDCHDGIEAEGCGCECPSIPVLYVLQ